MKTNAQDSTRERRCGQGCAGLVLSESEFLENRTPLLSILTVHLWPADS